MDNSKKNLNILFVARKFENMAGGVERISIDLMNSMIKRGHDVALITWDKKSVSAHYKIDQRVKWYKLNIGDPDASSSILTILKRLKKFRYFTGRFNPNIILGFQSGAALFSIIASIGKNYKTIAAERVSPDLWKYVGSSIKFKIINFLTWFLSSKITVQFPDYIYKYPRIFRHKIISIHNPVYPKITTENFKKDQSDKLILCVARLCYQKNQNFLIDVFSTFNHSIGGWKLILVGDGDYQERLIAKVKKLKLENRIIFCGITTNVNYWYQRAEIFAFPSLFEGFPNALAEALSWGIPSIGLKNTLGVNSLIKNDINGFLVDHNEKNFAEALKTLMNNDALRRSMSLEAKKINSMYPPKRTHDLWEMTFKELQKKND